MNTLKFQVENPTATKLYGTVVVRDTRAQLVYNSGNRASLGLPPPVITVDPTGRETRFKIDFLAGQPDSIGYFTIVNKDPKNPASDFLAAFSLSVDNEFYDEIPSTVFDYLPSSDKPVAPPSTWKTFYPNNVIPFMSDQFSRAMAQGSFKISGLENNHPVKISIRTLADNCVIYTPSGGQAKSGADPRIIELEYTQQSSDGKFELVASDGSALAGNANTFAVTISDTGVYDTIPTGAFNDVNLDKPITPVLDPIAPQGNLKVEDAKFAIVVAHWDDELLWNEPLIDKCFQIVQCGPATSSLRFDVAKNAYGSSKVVSLMPLIHIAEELEMAAPGTRCYRDTTLFNAKVLADALRAYVDSSGIKSIVTHNPWREYGHPNHSITFDACVTVALEKKLDLWFNDVYKLRQGTPVNEFDSYYGRAELSLPVSVDYARNSSRFNSVKTMYASASYGDWDTWTWLDQPQDNPQDPIKFFKYISQGNMQAGPSTQSEINAIISKVGITYTC